MPRNEMDQKKAAEGEKGGDASYDSARPDETTAKVEKAGKRRASSGSEKETGGLADSEEGEVALDELQLSADSKGGSRNERKGASDAETFFRAEKQKKAEKQEKEKVSVIDKDRHQAESSTEEKQRSPVVMKKAVPRRTASKEDEKEERSEAERVQTSPKKKMAEPGRADQKKETAASGDSKVARTDKKMALRDSASADKPEDARNIHVLHAKTLPSQLELLEKYVALRNDSLRKRITPFGLVNSFDYGYAPGKGRISIHTEAGPSPFSENEVLIKIGIVDNNLYKKPSADKSVFEKANQNDMAIGRVVFESATVAGDAWGNQESRKYSPEASSSGAAGSEQGLPGALTYLYELEIAEVLHKKETEDTLQLGKVVLGKGITGKETVTYPLSFRKSALIGDPPVKENPGLYLAACAKTFAQIIKKPPGKPRSDALDLVQRILTVVGANVPQNQEAKRLLQTVAEYAQTPTDVDGKE